MIVELRELFDTIEENDGPAVLLLPSDDEFPPQLEAFFQGATRHDSQVRLKRFFDLGLQQRRDFELRLGEYVAQN
jgi:hypothetical protein